MVGRGRELVLVLSLIVAAGCGGRTSILASDYETGFGGDQSVGRTSASSGSGGSGRTFGGSAATGAGGATGTGGSGAAGGTTTTGGGGGSTPTGSGGGGTTGMPGTGGTKAGQGGGSPDLRTACEDACKRQPAACVGSQSSDCDFSCAPLATEFTGCQQELTDYFNCLSSKLEPSAACMLANNGDCYGSGCTTEATDGCFELLRIFNNCEAGCSSTVSNDAGCSFERSCPSHDYLSSCAPTRDASDYDCSCTIDGTLVEGFTLSSASHDVCADADAQCASLER